MTSAYAETFAVRPSQVSVMKTSRSISIYTVDDIASRQSTFMGIDNKSISRPLLSTAKSAKHNSINEIEFDEDES